MGRDLRLRYFAKRTLASLLAMFLIVLGSFLLVELLPTSPFRDEKNLNPAVQKILNDQFGLQEPVWRRFQIFSANILAGEVGPSILQEALAPDFIAQRFKNSLFIGLISFCCAFFFAILTGFVLSLFPSYREFFWRSTQLLISIPVLVIVPSFIFIFGIYLQWLPVARLDSWEAWILPIGAMIYRPFLNFSRIFVQQIEIVEAAGYYRAQLSYGFSRLKAFCQVVLQNALIPLLVALPATFSSMISGSIVIETMFALPGLGSTYLEALLNRDVYLIVGMTCFYSFILILSQWLVDLLILKMDPRVQLA